MDRSVIFPLIAAGFIASCAGSRQFAVSVDLSRQDLARAEAAAAATLGRPDTAAFQDMHGFRLEDGSVIACAEMRGTDAFGADWGFAPVYVRIVGGLVVRVHADDTTGYGPASIACDRAEGGIGQN